MKLSDVSPEAQSGMTLQPRRWPTTPTPERFCKVSDPDHSPPCGAACAAVLLVTAWPEKLATRSPTKSRSGLADGLV